MEQLRSQANLDGAPSHLSAGSTKRTLFPSDALQLEKELEQVRKDKAAAVKAESYRQAHQHKLREKELIEEIEAVTRSG